MNNSLSLIVGVLVLLAVGVLVYVQSAEAPAVEKASYQETRSTTESNPATGNAAYSAADVGTHNQKNDCWSIINGGVYNLTSWISRHPGGERAITQLCGIDGSEEFNEQHAGGEQQAAVLAGFKIGELSR